MMSQQNDIKKITATFTGDQAIELELLEKSLRLDKLAKTKSERDNLFFSLALDSLRKSIIKYSKQHGTKYPSYEQMKDYLFTTDE